MSTFKAQNFGLSSPMGSHSAPETAVDLNGNFFSAKFSYRLSLSLII